MGPGHAPAQPLGATSAAKLSATELAILDTVRERIYAKVVRYAPPVFKSQAEERTYYSNLGLEVIPEVASELSIRLSVLAQQKVLSELLDGIMGFGKLQRLLDEDGISEVMVNGPKRIYYERAGKVLLSDFTFRSNEEVMNVIYKIIAPLGRRCDQGSPMVDARLPDGSRVNIIIPPLALNGPTLTIRKFSKKPLGIEGMVARGTLTSQMARFLEASVKARLNMVVSGGTGSGKTTTLNTISSFIPSDERIITIEDSAELQLQQDHVVRLETRPPNLEGKGGVTIRDLVKNTLRMRPERVVVGECRGGETLDMLQAMNTGHDGSLTTAHANTPKDAVARIETMVLMAGMDLPVRNIREQVASAVHVIIQQSRLHDGSRKITSITEVDGMDGDQVRLREIFAWRQEGLDENGKVLGKLVATGEIPSFVHKFVEEGIALPDDVFGEGTHLPTLMHEIEERTATESRIEQKRLRELLEKQMAEEALADLELPSEVKGHLLKWNECLAERAVSPLMARRARAVAGGTEDRPITADEKLMAQVVQRIMASMSFDSGAPAQAQANKDLNNDNPDVVRPRVGAILDDLLRENRSALTQVKRTELVGKLVDDITGLGPLQPLLDDPTVAEVMVNGPEYIYVERNGKVDRAPVHFRDDDQVRQVISRIVSPLGRRCDDSSPMVDARLKDGSRVNAIIPPASLIGPVITIRKFSKKALEVKDIVSKGGMTATVAEFLNACVQVRLNVVVSGGTGSGKTTTLNALSSFIPDGERVVTIEDAAELKMQQSHVVSLESRPPNSEGKGAIQIRDLVRNALRMRPDRIVVGECRGGESLDMLQAMNTGKDGSMTTGHANTPQDMIRRLETMVMMSGLQIPMRNIREMIASGVHLIIQQTRLKDGSRKITSVTEVAGILGDQVHLVDIFQYHQKGLNAAGKVVGEFKPTGHFPAFLYRFLDAKVPLSEEVFGPGTSYRQVLKDFETRRVHDREEESRRVAELTKGDPPLPPLPPGTAPFSHTTAIDKPPPKASRSPSASVGRVGMHMGPATSPGSDKEKLEMVRERVMANIFSDVDLQRRLGQLKNISDEGSLLVPAVKAAVDFQSDVGRLGLPEKVRREVVTLVLADVQGFGPIQPLLERDDVSEVMINGPRKIYFECKGKVQLADVQFRDDFHVMQIISKIVTPLGRRCDVSSPIVDARLPDGSRVNAIIPPLALCGPTLTIRKFSKNKLSVDRMIGYGSMTAGMAAFLKATVELALNIIVSGGTGSGKTTTLNALSGYIPPDERIVTVEDSAELQLQQDHVVRLETRPANVEGKGQITIRDLIKNCLRMRPDRVVVGECRAGETLDMLQAMNTGHEGSLTTAHANTPVEMMGRIEVMVMMAGTALPSRAIREQIASAIDLVVQQNRFHDGSRRVTHITAVRGIGPEGQLVLDDIFRFEHRGLGPDHKIQGEFVYTGARPPFLLRIKREGIHLPDDVFGPGTSIARIWAEMEAANVGQDH